MYFKRILALGLGAVAVLTALPARAQEVPGQDCAARDRVVNRLASDYDEVLTAGGLNGNAAGDTVVEIWTSPKTGTFTVLSTDAHGQSCIIATGTDWFGGAAQLTAARKESGIEG